MNGVDNNFDGVDRIRHDDVNAMTVTGMRIAGMVVMMCWY